VEPWRFDPSVHPIEWRDGVEMEWEERKRLKVGVMRSDGVVPPSPACARAVQMVVDALEADGHTVKDVTPPSPYEGLKLGADLLNADGCKVFSSPFYFGERNDPGASEMWFYMRLPRFIKHLHNLWIRWVRSDHIWAGLLRHWYPKTAQQNWGLVVKREEYRAQWFDWWNDAGIDFLITTPNATPALPHGAMKDAVSSCGYTFLFNVLDYTAGVIPVTKVDPSLDKLPPDFNTAKLNGVAKGAYKYYDAKKMTGLPVGVQIVGRRLEEEKVLALMRRIEQLLEARGEKYELLSVID